MWCRMRGTGTAESNNYGYIGFVQTVSSVCNRSGAVVPDLPLPDRIASLTEAAAAARPQVHRARKQDRVATSGKAKARPNTVLRTALGHSPVHSDTAVSGTNQPTSEITKRFQP